MNAGSLILLAVALSMSPDDPGITGPTKARPGGLVVLDSGPLSTSEQRAWLILPETVAQASSLESLEVEDGRRLVLVGRQPCVLTILLFRAKVQPEQGLSITRQRHVLELSIAPDPQPTPPAPIPPGLTADAVKAAFEASFPAGPSRTALAKSFAANYRKVASEASRALALPGENPLKTLAGILAETTRLNRAVLPESAEARGFFRALAALLEPLKITEAGQIVAPWLIIADGLEACS